MKMYLNVAGLKRVNLNKLCTGRTIISYSFLKNFPNVILLLNLLCVGCSNSEERANRILNLLHEKGLQGEPTVEKCKQLRKDLRIRREIEGLDPNVIIQGDTEGKIYKKIDKTIQFQNILFFVYRTNTSQQYKSNTSTQIYIR